VAKRGLLNPDQKRRPLRRSAVASATGALVADGRGSLLPQPVWSHAARRCGAMRNSVPRFTSRGVFMRAKLIAFALLAALATTAGAKGTLTEQSQARARKVIDAAVAALGGAEALQSIDFVRLQLQGDVFPRLQMPTPNPPFEPSKLQETLLLDIKASRLVLEQRNAGGGFEGHNTIVIQGGEGTNYDHRARTATPIPAAQATQQQFIQYYRRLPQLILRQALERASTLRYLGSDTHDGRRHDVVTLVMADAQQVALYVDAKTGFVSKYELLFTDPLRGEQASQISFDRYVSAGRYSIPQQWNWKLAGDVAARYQVKAAFNPPAGERTADIPSTYQTVAALPNNLKPDVEKLADNVIVVHNVAAPNYNTMAVAFRDHIVAIEAPFSSDGADKVIERIKETWPGKPIRYVAVTHHHGDHIGGLRSFIAEGATVVTTPTNRGVVETMASTRQSDRLGGSPRKPAFLLVEGGRRVLSDGEETIELIDVGPNPHAREMLIAWLPKQRIVFQGDLFFIPPNDAPQGPPQPSTLSFAQKLKEKNLVPEKIASVHGRTATIEEFLRALAAPAVRN
jgi:glyoxylase-like metal-dependent hydrolase (beta-lactamase superfamily II)